VGAEVVDENYLGEELFWAGEGGEVGLGVVGLDEEEGFGGGGDVELVVVGAGGVGEDGDAGDIIWSVGQGVLSNGAGRTDMQSAIRAISMPGTLRITSVKVSRG
jgi:hypothetical protein